MTTIEELKNLNLVLRPLFAGLVLHAMVASGRRPSGGPQYLVDEAVLAADALIERLNQPKKKEKH